MKGERRVKSYKSNRDQNKAGRYTTPENILLIDTNNTNVNATTKKNMLTAIDMRNTQLIKYINTNTILKTRYKKQSIAHTQHHQIT